MATLPPPPPILRSRSLPTRGRHGAPRGDVNDGRRWGVCTVAGRSLSAPPPFYPEYYSVHVECNMRARLESGVCSYRLASEFPPFWMNHEWTEASRELGCRNPLESWNPNALDVFD